MPTRLSVGLLELGQAECASKNVDNFLAGFTLDSYELKGELPYYWSLFFWCYCSAEAAAITATPGGEEAVAWESSELSC
jgi:hypothetical protein